MEVIFRRFSLDGEALAEAMSTVTESLKVRT